jgi:surface polysaccharide O-acyltransferase-like enzyme
VAKPRIFYVDAIRAYAIGLVVVSHVFAPVSAGLNDYPFPTWCVFNLLNSSIRLCVPLFVMISGLLYLGSSRQESYLEGVGRRFARIVPPFFVWSMIYAFYEARMSGDEFSFIDALKQFIQGPTEFHLWFMYMILGVFLIAPFLKRFVLAAERGELARLLLFWLGFLFVGFFIPGYASSGPAATLLGYGGYFVLGYYLGTHDVFTGKTRMLGLVSGAIVVINALATWRLAIERGGVVDQRYYAGLAPLVAIYAACFFLILKQIDYDALYRRFSGLQRAVTFISLDSYNLYLIHVFFLWLFTKGYLGFVVWEKTGGTPWIGVPLTSLLLLSGSLMLSYVLRRIPKISKWLVVSAG